VETDDFTEAGGLAAQESDPAGGTGLFLLLFIPCHGAA
jgi:hypothetical protein